MENPLLKNLNSGKCGLQSLLAHLDVIHRNFQNAIRYTPQEGRDGLFQIYMVWHSLGNPTDGIWGQLVFIDHTPGCDCGGWPERECLINSAVGHLGSWENNPSLLNPDAQFNQCVGVLKKEDDFSKWGKKEPTNT